MTHDEAKAVLLQIADALITAVEAAGDRGAPGGVLYAAAMGHMTLQQFTMVMNALVKAGKLTKRGHCYYVGG